MKRLVIFFGHFSENDEDTLQSLPLNVRDQTLIQVQKKRKKRNKD
jgi:hypothetical protein